MPMQEPTRSTVLQVLIWQVSHVYPGPPNAVSIAGRAGLAYPAGQPALPQGLFARANHELRMGFALPCSTSPQAAEESGISWEGATGLRGILKECKRLGAHLSAGDRWHARLHCVAVNTDYEQEVKNMQQAALLHGSFIHLSHSGQLL